MPIEIKELHIRVAVNSAPAGQPAAAKRASGAGGETDGADKDAIVAECVEQVMQILQARTER